MLLLNIKKDIVLDQINLIIKKNDKIIIKGRSLDQVNLHQSNLFVVYTPTEGQILIDNKNIKNINIENLRSQISMLNQNVKLFNISIYDNIRYTNKNVSKEIIDKFINKHKINLYNDLDLNSKAGQNGNNLSEDKNK